LGVAGVSAAALHRGIVLSGADVAQIAFGGLDRGVVAGLLLRGEAAVLAFNSLGEFSRVCEGFLAWPSGVRRVSPWSSSDPL
jgi:hypothetical protein